VSKTEIKDHTPLIFTPTPKTFSAKPRKRPYLEDMDSKLDVNGAKVVDKITLSKFFLLTPEDEEDRNIKDRASKLFHITHTSKY
jgi:hypothetical protein